MRVRHCSTGSSRGKKRHQVLRIEDTDVDRSEARFEDQLIADLKWLGLDWDEGPDVGGEYGPYRQSDRLPIYREHAERLLSEHKAYLCFCTEEELQKERDRATAEHRQPIYSGKCRAIDRRVAAPACGGEACAIRLRIPEHPIRFRDIVHGDVEFSNEVVSDPIILRSSGMPVYNYVVVIDDALMKITHVIRGDDHLSNTPKQVALYEALGWPVPEFAHLSTILGADRERLSNAMAQLRSPTFATWEYCPKRWSIIWLCWGGRRPEVRGKSSPPKELVKEFSLERITPSPAVFDMEKLYWLNRHYIKTLPPDDLIAFGLWFFEGRVCRIQRRRMAKFPSPSDCPGDNDLRDWFGQIVRLLAPYVDRLDQLPERASSIFNYDAKAALAAPDNAEVLAWPNTDAVFARFTVKIMADESASTGQLTPEQFKKIVNEVKAETGAKGKELFHPIRIVITGSHSGPDFDRLIPILEAAAICICRSTYSACASE